MGITISKYQNIVEDALKFRGIRADIITSNLANIDTPFYNAKDIEFEKVLRREAETLDGRSGKKLQLAQTNSMHLSPKEEISSTKASIYFRPNHATRNDGNSVDLDIETTRMSQNAIMINAITAALKKRSQLFKAVIDTSSRVN